MHEKMEELKFKKNDERTKECASKAGKRSGEVRKFKRDVQKLLDSAPFRSKTFDGLKKMLEGEENITTRVCIIASMIERAARGDVQAATFLRDTAGEKPKEEIVVDKVDENTLHEVEDYIESVNTRKSN